MGTILFLRYGPKCSQPIKLEDFLINYISRTIQWNSLIFCMYVYTNSHKLKFIKNLVRIVSNGCGWNSKTDYITRMDRWNELRFFHAGANSGNEEIISMIYGHQKWAWLFSSWGHKICCIIRVNLWIELIFYMLTVMEYVLVRLAYYSVTHCSYTFYSFIMYSKS